MQQLTPRLALPIKCVVDADGRLLAADSAVRRLHFANGGLDGGILAVPALLDLASLCWRIGVRLDRTVPVADKDHDLELWVEAERQEKSVNLSIIGWQERNMTPRPFLRMASHPTTATSRAAFPVMHVDHLGTVQRLEARLAAIFGTESVAAPFDEHFRAYDEKGEIPAISGLAAKRSDRLRIEHLRSKKSHEILVDTVQTEEGALRGFRFVFTGWQDESEAWLDANAEPALSKSGLGLGKHFASAVKQPLGRILANAETIGSQLNGPILDQYSSYARDIASAARHLAELVSDLEDLDAIDKPDFKVAQEPVDLGDIAKRVVGLLALKAADHQIDLVIDREHAKGLVIGEFRRVLQIVLNLVGNAIRYSPGGSRVTIAIDMDGPTLSVSDEGAGIPEEDRERIFTKFERLGRSGDGGSGLGLYISRKLARAMGGDLSVGSNEKGGATFTLRLPPN